jgi:hypothetical protein
VGGAGPAHARARSSAHGDDGAPAQALPDLYRGAGLYPAKTLKTYELDISKPFPPLIQRIVQSGEKNPKIRIRNVDKSKFDAEAALILDILNDAWSDNWGSCPSPTEIAYAGKKFKPIVREDLIMVAEYEGEPVAFMMTLPDLNEVLRPMQGKLFPFNWIKLLLWLRKPKVRTMRVPLMGVRKRLQASRLASQLAFMMIEYIRRNSVANYWREPRRDRLDPGRQPGNDRHCRRDRQPCEQGIRNLPEGAVSRPPRYPAGCFPAPFSGPGPALTMVIKEKGSRRGTGEPSGIVSRPLGREGVSAVTNAKCATGRPVPGHGKIFPTVLIHNSPRRETMFDAGGNQMRGTRV